MKVLIVGSGGREHVIGECISKSPKVSKIYFAPGNGGTNAIGENIDIKADNLEALLKFALDKNIDYTVVGPEDPLCMGIVDLFEQNGLSIFGPSKEAAKLEDSKAFAKDFMTRHNIPTAKYIETEDLNQAIAFSNELIDDYGKAVIKADGLCAGKGVFIVNSKEEALKYLEKIFISGEYGRKKVVIEEFLDGFEISLIGFTDGKTIKLLPTSKDHKKILDGEKGSNTGGMGTYSPNIQAEPYLDEIEKLVVKPFLKGIKKDQLDYRGIIFIGLMIGSKGISVLEFNTRFGDPETQSILNRIDNDLLDLMMATTNKQLSEIEIIPNNKKVVCLVLASGGYPGDIKKGYEILGLDELEGVKVYHAGTKLDGDKLVTWGGRVLSLVAIEDNFEDAIRKVYREAEKVKFTDKYYRKDIGPMVRRIYTEIKDEYDSDYIELKKSLVRDLGFHPGDIRVLHRYDIDGLTIEDVEKLIDTSLYNEMVNKVYYEETAFQLEESLKNPLVVEFHKGQFNEKEEALIKNIELVNKKKAEIASAIVYDFSRDLSKEKRTKLEKYLINPVNQKEGRLIGLPSSLKTDIKTDIYNHIFDGFIAWNDEELEDFRNQAGLAMSFDDLKFIQDHYKKLKRDINETELYILDTYWSDHCRHTTFNTILDIKFDNPKSKLDERIQDEFNEYLKLRKHINRTKDITLMDMGTIVAKVLMQDGVLTNVEESDEVNACSIEVDVLIRDNITLEEKTERYLLMFKNETHNHPTEIEPFGGASTCLGGCIRDPLSGRAYVYQAMRVIGGKDPREQYDKTLEGKLAQKKIAIEASDGYSSYGNEIAVPGGFVEEIYHDRFVAKRMELGALVAAVPKANIIREKPSKGDIILLIGGRTGRDGVGGATGSSRVQTEDSIVEASAEVQRGNAPIERNIIRLFRKKEVTEMIKTCNDFGAGGVSVAIGELADSLDIYLDRVPLKYPGLSPKEIAISESQERMAVLISKENEEKFLEYCYEEDVEATTVADVTDTGRMIMYYNDQVIADIDRDFINTSGVTQEQDVHVENFDEVKYFDRQDNDLNKLYRNLKNPNFLSQKNVIGKFDFTAGGNTVLAPLGGKNQLTPIQAMVSRIPVESGEAQTCSIMSYGYDPYLSIENQFLGGYYAVIESLTKVAAVGGNPFRTNLTFQEFFESLGKDPIRWSKPLKSILGAMYACREMEVAPIGGKDSMSGSFKDIDVPPTLISFAVTTEDIANILTPELKGGAKLGLIKTPRLEDHTLDHEIYKSNMDNLYKDIKDGNIISAYALNYKGLAHGIIQMALGNDVGFTIDSDELYDVMLGSVLVEYKEDRDYIELIGLSGGESMSINGEKIDTEIFLEEYEEGLSDVYPASLASREKLGENKNIKSRRLVTEKPVEDINVLIPIFAGTTGEDDIYNHLIELGAKPKKHIFKNIVVDNIDDSLKKLAEEIRKAQILILPAGMTYANEPDSPGKYIGNVLRDINVRLAINDMLLNNDGLILGIQDGFQALVDSGLLPYGEIKDMKEMAFVKNPSGRYQAEMVSTIAKTNNSPWLKYIETKKEYNAILSNAYGRLIVDKKTYKELSENEQIAFVYGENKVGADYGIEGLLSPDGKILGKMTNFERIKDGSLINLPKSELQHILRAGVEYFKK